MLKRNVVTLVLVSVALFAAACGSDKNNTKAPGAASALAGPDGQGGSYCSDSFNQDVAALQTNVNNTPQTVEGYCALKQTLVNFKTKYEGVVCTSKDAQGKVEKIDVTKTGQEVIGKIDAAIAQSGGTCNGGAGGH